MPSLNLGQKVNRVVTFLMGVRQRRSSMALRAHGFTQSDMDEGVKLLNAVIGARMSTSPVALESRDVEKLDQWENVWFPIADATLTRNYPSVREKLFLNLSQTDGPEVVVSVGIFVQRLAALHGGTKEERGAYELLSRRGLNADVIGQAQKLLERVRRLEEPEEVDLEKERAEQKAAEDAMWAWYLEWSSIARTAIQDGRVLQSLGFLRPNRREREEEDVAEAAPPGAVA